MKQRNELQFNCSSFLFLLSLSQRAFTAAGAGCGMTACADTRAIVQGFIENSEAPMVLDADALNAIAEEPAVLRKAKAPLSRNLQN